MTGGGAPSEVLDADVVAELRHELRTPMNLVVGYCEMLLEDAAGDALADRRDALRSALVAVREAVTAVTDALPASERGGQVRASRLAGLAEALRGPRERIVAAMDRVLASPGAAEDAALVDDVGRVRDAAGALDRVLAGYVSDVAQASSAVAADAEPGAADAAGAATVLVVDDLEANRTLLERRLRRDGHHVLCAAGGREALDRLAAGRVDLVLLDVMMPDMDGVAVLERMKADPALRDLPVVMISALDDAGSVAGCLTRGADDYLPKPFDPVILRARVGALLERKRLRDAELAYLREVDAIARAAGAIEQGTYAAGALAATAARPDALGRLARVLDGMAVRVRSREDGLHAHIRQLEAEVALATAGRGPGAPPDEAGAEGSTPDATQPARPFADGPLAVGQTFAGRYQVRALLGRGGMGTVYLADDQELGEPVAVKVLRRALGDDEDEEQARKRFREEIRLARRLSHRNVVRTHDFGLHDGVPFVTMEYVRGVTLRELLDTRGALGVEAALAIGTQLAHGLAVAHEEGVVHRDVKPQNLLLDARGTLKVMDFGVARLVERTTTFTRVGMVVGTPAYMAPEQLLEEQVDGRADLYAAGVVLFETLTGRLPYAAATVAGLVAQMLTQAPPEPRAVNPDVPAALSDVVLRLLARAPADRPASAADLARLLDGAV